MAILHAISEALTAVAAATGAFIAVLGLNAWKKQLKGKTDYELARRYLRAVYKLRDAVQNVRNPFIPAEEMNAALKQSGKEGLGDGVDTQEGVRAAYSARWQKVTEAGSDLSVELREAEVSWGRKALDIERDMEKCVQELFVTLRMYVQHNERPNRDLIYDQGDNDEYTKRLTTAVTKIEAYLAPHLR